MDEQTRNILEILEEDARIVPEEIASLTGMTVEEVSQKIEYLEKAKIIRKYKTIIDWELAGENYVYAIIELKVQLERKLGYQAIAERLYKFPEVRSVRLLSGEHDISITVRGNSMKQVAFFVAEKIATLDQVQSTATHFVLKTYKENGLILDEPDQVKRLAVSP
ncbi:AsnC family transcriptional regulator [Methanococcoides methylutens]|uniref:AsnC family transcriptional regulator n=1 Tax=Methanococcoides methylutens TaxID=2226 RepID=A0A099T231_METMT|nr:MULTISPECIES: Lrp/AsnC family transcriptional regulator [Methanococcoides]KGK99225.1 AsnC family transcriptional regulator [Methanococcoides methylutens]UGV40678.1 Lrp/AsnC family transcriptional regulator [Methanococcoides orientis]